MDTLVAAVKAHALAHYGDDDCWDYVVECWEDDYIAEVVEGATTEAGAIAKAAAVVAGIAEARDEALAEVF